MKSTLLTLFAAAIILLSGSLTVSAQQNRLPQNHDYQVVLRDYIATFSESDFNVPLNNLTYNESYLNSLSNDELFGLWLMFRTAPPQGPIAMIEGLTVAPRHFTLNNIESSDGIRMGSRNNRPWFPPEVTAWWASWDYPGNPYYNHSGVMNRAFVYCIVEMLMLDQAHENGQHRRSDYLGGTLIWMSYVYHVVKPTLPSNVRAAYETGLMRFIDRLEQWGANDNLGDMHQAAHVSMSYTAKAIGTPEIKNRVASLIEGVLDETYRPAGYITHGDGFDAPYNGISIDYITWAALASGNEDLTEAMGQMSKLKSYLSLPDPDGRFYGPSHFNTTTSTDPANDLKVSLKRDVGAAMLSDYGKYLIWDGRNGSHFNLGVPTRDEMKSRISLLTNRTNNHLEPSSLSPEIWKATHWGRDIPYSKMYVRPGFYDEISALENSDDPLTRAPFNRSENFIQQFPRAEADVDSRYDREFLSAKFDDYGVILHTGRLSWWGGTNTTNMSGFGGGAISAFWTPGSGSVILGRTAGFQGPKPDTWDNWREWPTHAVSGLDGDGSPFSTARNRYPGRSYTVNDDYALVTVNGKIGNSHDGGSTTRDDGLPGGADYTRRFHIDNRGLTVETRISSAGNDRVREMYEMLPVFLGNGSGSISNADVAVSLKVNDTWHGVSTSPRSGVTEIRIRRFGQDVYITFDQPQSVKISPARWKDEYQSNVEIRNIMVDLLGNEGSNTVDMPGSIELNYTVSTEPRAPQPIDISQPSAPAIISPEHQAVNVETNPLIRWSSVENASGYQFVAGQNASLDNPEVEKRELENPEVRLDNLEPNTTYYFSVRASQTNGSESDWSEVRSFTTSGEPTSSNRKDGLPETYALEENYPNPFNPLTQIRYALPASGDVTLQVYDITGRLIATLVNQYQQAGYHEINFNASDLASGVYLYRLQSGSFEQSRQMILLK